MKVLFLDIDGVLNKKNTKEYFKPKNIQGRYTGIDQKLLKVFLDWREANPFVNIVLSSDWRKYDDFRMHLNHHGVFWQDETPRIAQRWPTDPLKYCRGHEVQETLDRLKPEKYAILDDFGPTEFLKKQRQFLVQTSEFRGIEEKKLKRINEILNE